MNAKIRPIQPRNFRETRAIREAHDVTFRKQFRKFPGKAIPAFNGAHKGNKNRPITLPKV